MPIRVLEPAIAAQIAAGEVVERPASVVKELVENALDAGARRVTVGVRGGGIEELIIQDDGGGIPADEIEVAFARHATSKLRSADDLWAIDTLGFRGEALPSIASVAQVICQSRTAGAAAGAELRVAGGEVQQVVSRGGPTGTTFTIRNLFYNVPVRREFLKSPAAEAAAIAAVVAQYALAYPQVAFTLLRDGKRVFQTSGRGQLADVILELYGVEVARQMLAIDAQEGEDLAAVRVQGMVSAPTISRGSRDGMHITVNGRAITPRGQVGAIIEEAYHTLLMKGRFPLVVLRIVVHPAAVDVNIHPTKSEVKFRHPQHVGRVLGRAVREAVQGMVVIQGWSDGDTAADSDPGDQPAQPPASIPEGAAAQPAGEPGSTIVDVASAAPEQAEPSAARPPAAEPADQAGHESTRQEHATDLAPTQATLLATQPYAESRNDWRADRPADAAWPSRATDSAADADLFQQRHTPPAEEQHPPARLIREAPPHSAISENTPPTPAPTARAATLPPLRALAQLGQTYLLTEGPDGALYLIDQHAAHERITYERLLAQHGAGAVQSQALLLPQYVALPPDAQQTLLAAADELAAWGFALDEADGGVQIQAVPAGLPLEDLATTAADLAGHLIGDGGRTPADRQDAMLATLACHTSVRAGQSLTVVEQQALIAQLAGCEGPRTCPHGRPTLIVITKHQLERQFGRLGA